MTRSAGTLFLFRKRDLRTSFIYATSLYVRYQPAGLGQLSIGGWTDSCGLAFGLALTKEPPNPEIIAGKGKGGSEEGCKERDKTGQPSAPTAGVDGVDGTAHLDGTVLVGISPGGGYLTAAAVVFILVGGTKAAASLGYYLKGSWLEGNLPVAGMLLLCLLEQVLPVAVG